jgi:hypothetical protein
MSDMAFLGVARYTLRCTIAMPENGNSETMFLIPGQFEKLAPRYRLRYQFRYRRSREELAASGGDVAGGSYRTNGVAPRLDGLQNLARS